MGHFCGNFSRYLRGEVFRNVYDARLILHGYQIHQEELGSGLFSKIKRASSKGKHFAVKIMDKEKMPEVVREKYIVREVEILKQIHHKNIVEIHRIFDYPPKVYIFMELINGQTLHQRIQEKGRMEETEARFLFQQLVNAIEYLHRMEISHRDLKPENVMIHNEAEVKIVDFGFAIQLGTPDDMNLIIWGRTPYTAPEVSQSLYDPLAFDIWSLGCVLFNMVTGTTPFHSSEEEQLVKEQMAKLIFYPTDYKLSTSLMHLLNEMLEPNALQRATIDQVKESDWLRKMDSARPSASKQQNIAQISEQDNIIFHP